VFDRPRTFHVDCAGVSAAISGFPFAYGDIRRGFGQVLSATGWNERPADVRLLAVHQAFEGATVGPVGFRFTHSLDVIRPADVPSGFAAVLGGHIHRSQILLPPAGSSVPPVIYPGSIERTSFAEKDDPKGFYDLGLAPDWSGRWCVREQVFVELPARPMVDVEIDYRVSPDSLEDHLRDRLSGAEPEAIVRLKADPALDRQVAARITAAFVRSVCPPGMNVQIGRGIYPDRPFRSRH
jgi:DNA repair exonuclease SbcCD nuclease subunit